MSSFASSLLDDSSVDIYHGFFFCSNLIFFLFGGCFSSCFITFVLVCSVPVVEKEVACILDILDLDVVLSELLLLSLVCLLFTACLLFLDLLFDFFADFFIFHVDLDSLFAFFRFAILISSFTSDSKDLQLDDFLALNFRQSLSFYEVVPCKKTKKLWS